MIQQTGQYDIVIDRDGSLRAPVSHSDVVAWRPDPTQADGRSWVQITDLFGAGKVIGNVSWSNDGADSFISFSAIDYRGRVTVDENGVSTLDLRGMAEPTPNTLFRIPISGAMIELIADVPEIQATGDDLEEIGVFRTRNGASWSPEGAEVAYADWAAPNALQVRDVATGTSRTLWDASQGSPSPVVSQWCPAPGSRKILIGGPGVWMADADSIQQPTLFLGNKGTTTYNAPLWSPDGSLVVYVRIQQRASGAHDHWIERVPANGGSAVGLTTDLSSKIQKGAIAWVSDLAP
jgi:hypothetical protein